MPFAARTLSFLSNVVKNPQFIPVEMVKGKVTWSDALESAATASIEYESVDAQSFSAIQSAYKIGNQLSIYGLSYRIKEFSYSRSRVFPDDKPIEFFNVSISLEQPKENIKKYNFGGTAGNIGFAADQIITDGQNSVSLFEQGYNNAELTFGDQSEDEQEPIPDQPKTIFRLKQSIVQQTREGDESAKIPPTNTKVLRDTTSNFDESGPKKMIKTTLRQDGQLLQEELYTYGFAYLQEDITVDGTVLYDANPQRFWVPIQFERTVYNYQSAGTTILNVRVTPPGETGVAPRSLKFAVHPDYDQFASISDATLNGFNVYFRSNAQYLVGTVTTGWKLLRLKKEDDRSNSLDPDDPYYPYFHFQKIPYYSRSYYLLKNSRGLFGAEAGSPYRIEFSDYNTLPTVLKQQFAQQDITQDGKVAILYPDPNYVEPLFIQAESTQSNSFTWALDPDGQEPDPDKFIPGTNRKLPPTRLITGEESYTETRRVILSSDRYTEHVVEYSSQDPGFDNSAERYSFREVSGRPPEPQNRLLQYESRQVAAGLTQPGSYKQVTKYYVSTPSTQKYVDEGGSVSVTEAKTFEDAVKQLEDSLRKSHIQANSASKTVAWFYPELRAGNYCSFEGDRIAGNGNGSWMVTGVTWTLEFGGKNNKLGQLLVTTPGTQLQLGLDKSISVQGSSRIEIVPNNQQGSIGDPTIETSVVFTPTSVSEIFPPLPNRRNF